jgi:hypothetical protein
MRPTLLLVAFGAFAIAMLFLGSASLRVEGLRGGVKQLVALVETKALGYEPLP